MAQRITMLLPKFRWMIGLLVVLSGFVMVGNIPEQPASAAVPPPAGTLPSVIAVNISTTSNSATIAFTTDYSAWARIQYGTGTTYGSFAPAGGAYADPGPGDDSDHQIIISNLNSGTTYHFTIETVAPNSSSPSRLSPDRSFTTGTVTSGTALTITNVSSFCVGGNCRVSYSTAVPSNVQLRYGTNSGTTFGSYPSGVGESTAEFVAQSRSLDITGLSTNSTTYYYRLQATDQNGNVFTSGEFSFVTGQDDDDRTFSTGSCSDGTPIGSCSVSGAICEPGGNLVFRCDSICGFNCPSGQSCSANGQCVSDPALTGSPSQCNDSSCYNADGTFKLVTPAGQVCYRSWPRCTANTVLKVRKDRGCDLWLTCVTSIQTEQSSGTPSENICLALGACNKLGPNGQCISFLPSGQCTNDPLRFCSTDADCEAPGSCATYDPVNPNSSLSDVQYTTPDSIRKIANLSGNVIAGLDWNVGTLANVSNSGGVRGFLPWQLMQQIGGTTKLENGDLEQNPPSTDPWEAVPIDVTPSEALQVIFEDVNTSHNHMLHVAPIDRIDNRCSNDVTKTCTTASAASDCGTGATCEASQSVLFSGVATTTFDASPEELYFAEARIKSDGKARIRMQFGYENYTQFTVTNSDGTTSNTYVDVDLTSAWQRVTIGPISGMSGKTRLAFVIAPGQSPIAFDLDDVQVRPVLQASTSPTYITPSCRLYPKEDSPACDYVDQNGISYQGWRGYCLENDSVTGTCLSWWPVDLIKGESDLFGSEKVAGYQDRQPLYYCAESAGNYNKPDPLGAGTNNGYSQLMATTVNVYRDCEEGDDCDAIVGRGIGGGSDTYFGTSCSSQSACGVGPATPRAEDQLIHDYDIHYIILQQDDGQGGFQGMGTRYLTEGSTYTSGCAGRYFGQPWSACFQLGTDTSNPQFAEFHFGFDATDHHFNGIYFYADDGTTLSGSFHFRVYFVLKEQCTKLVQVVRPGTITQAFASRVAQGSTYTVDQLNYNKNEDLTPFGGALQFADFGNDPKNWPPLEAQLPNTTQISAPGQARSGSPYACIGNCSTIVCTVNPSSNNCLTNPQGCFNTDINGDGEGDGQCIGVGSTVATQGVQNIDPAHNPTLINDANAFAMERIRRLFTRSLGAWRLVNGRYVSDASLGWNPPGAICPLVGGVPTRPSSPDDYCAVPPNVFCGDTKLCSDGRKAAFLGTSSDTLTVAGESGVVTIKFNTDADTDQVPLQTIRINWGDEISTIAFPYHPRNDPSRPHIISHAYRIIPGSAACSGAGASQSCLYDIKIQVVDNWDWCNDASGSTQCQSDPNNWVSTGLKVRVTH